MKLTAAFLAALTVASISIPAAEAQTRAQLQQAHQRQMQALRRQQQAQLRNLREQQKAQRQWSNNFNNYSNRGWGWGNNLDWRQRRIQQLRSEIGSTMDLGKRAAMHVELRRLLHGW
jgi:type II secretory pathway pseudopilin PulG